MLEEKRPFWRKFTEQKTMKQTEQRLSLKLYLLTPKTSMSGGVFFSHMISLLIINDDGWIKYYESAESLARRAKILVAFCTFLRCEFKFGRSRTCLSFFRDRCTSYILGSMLSTRPHFQNIRPYIYSRNYYYFNREKQNFAK